MDLESLCYVTVITFTVALSPLGSRNDTAMESIRTFHFYYHISRDLSDKIIREEEQKEGVKGHYAHFRSRIREKDLDVGIFYYGCTRNVLAFPV